MKRLTTLALLAGMLSAPALHSEEPGSGSAAPLSFPQLNDAADSEPGDEPPAASPEEGASPAAPATAGDAVATAPAPVMPDLPPPVSGTAAPEVIPVAPVWGGDLNLAQMGMPDGIILSGGQRQGGVSFTLPADQVVIHSQLSLAVRVSPEMASRNATLQLMLNGQPLGTLPLGADGEDVSHYQLDIPPALMVSSNNLSVKINDGDTLQCQRDIHDTSRVTVLPTSHFSWESQQLNISDDLSHFPRPFFDSMQMTPADIAVAYGAKPSADVFSAAALISSWLGIQADSGLRQALLWLGPQAGDEQYYDTWMQRHPQDSEVQNYFRERRSGQARGQGYANLNSGNTAAAKQQFEEVLQTNPQDADALAGMGYIAQRSGDYQAASQYLSRAADLGGDASATRRQQAADALFYGQLAQAQQAYKQGNISQALALSAPLAQQSGAQGASAKLFRADVLRHNKDLPQAEQTLRSLLNDDPQNAAARENLYYVLREQNKSAEAQAMLQTLPQSLRQKLQPRVVAGMPGDALRRQAQAQVSGGNPAGAIATLREGVARYPDDPWLRLDLARLLQKSGNGSEASSLMSAAYRPGASNSALYAAALFASENGAWQQAQTLLARIPGGSQTSDMRDLRQRVNYNLQLVTAENYLAQGNTIAASNTLRAMASTPPKAPADAGKLARLLAESGDLTTAVSLVRNNISSGVSGNAGDYADQIAVLNQAGLTGEAQNLISNPQLQASSAPTQLASIRNGYVINEADRLREQDNYAAAYDKLIRAMQSDPQNTDLMFAMARLYQSGKMNKEAGVV